MIAREFDWIPPDEIQYISLSVANKQSKILIIALKRADFSLPYIIMSQCTETKALNQVLYVIARRIPESNLQTMLNGVQQKRHLLKPCGRRLRW